MAKNVDENKSNNELHRGRRNELVGYVISDKMSKTISVEVFRLVKHSKYSKYIKRSSVFKAHDEKNEAKSGDKVSIGATRPLSKTKRWSLIKVLEKGSDHPEVNV
ncbi:MAG: 30S ribosomal protein S17 [Bdellovibrionales bacterium]|nr:30S ribosomal protein S17 [Bdellovibrionales bacterium]